MKEDINWLHDVTIIQKKCFSENLPAIGLRKTELKMKKPDYLGLSILDNRKIAMYWYDYVK